MAVLGAAHGHAARRGTPAVPSVRASFGNTANATTCVVTLPAGIATGDVGIIVVNTDPNGPMNTPAGWTKLATKLDNGASGSVSLTLFKRIMASTDSGTTVTLTRTASAPISASGVIVQGASDVGVGPATGRNALAVNPAGQTVKFPAVKPGRQDLVIAYGVARGYTSQASAAPQIATPPTGFTTRDNRSVGYLGPGLAVQYASWIMSGPVASADGVSITGLVGDQSYMIGGLLTISPGGRRPTNKLPASLTNAAIHGYGTSYLGYVSDATAHSSEVPWYERIAKLLGTPAEDNNMGLPGAFASDICGHAYGTVAYYTRAVQLDPNFAVQQAGTWMAQSVRSGLVLLDLFGNDALNEADTRNSGSVAKSRAGARNAAESLVRLLRAASVVQETDASCAYAGTWTANSGVNDFSGGTNKQTTAPGSTVTITTTQPDIDLVLFAADDLAFGVQGAAFTVTVDGTQVYAGTTSNQMRKSSSTVYNASAYTQLTVPVRNMGAGTHTIVVMHTGAAGNGLFFDGYLIPAATPPWIVLNKLAHYAPALYSGLTYASSDSVLDVYSAFCDQIAALFPDGRVLVHDPLASGLWDYTSMVTTYDNLHLNDAGAAHYARGITKLLQERVA